MFSEASQITTYLSMVRTDQSQISQILDETFKEAHSKALKENISKCESLFEPFFRQCKIFLFGQINFEEAASQLKKASAGKAGGVCAKTLSVRDVAWKCEDCELDPTCIICQDCFEKGNHKGHKVWLKKNVSGCCDCGDPDAWRENGFCSDHKGYEASADQLLQMIPQFMKTSAQYVFEYVCRQIKIQSLRLLYFRDLNKRSKSLLSLIMRQNPYGHIISQMTFVSLVLINKLYDFLSWAIEASPAFIFFITGAMEKSYFESIKLQVVLREGTEELKIDLSSNHKCCYKGFTSAEEKVEFYTKVRAFADEANIQGDTDDPIESNLLQIANTDQIASTSAKLEILKQNEIVCLCNPIDLAMQTNSLLIPECRNNVYNFLFKLFQSYRFKQQLALSFMSNFEILYQERSDKMKNHLSSIGVQILTIDEISLMLMKDEQLREIVLSTLNKVIQTNVMEDYENENSGSLFHILYDLKYMCRPRCLNYLVMETNFLENMLEPLTKIYFSDLITFQEKHVLFEQDAFKAEALNMDFSIMKIYKKYINEVDPSNIERSKRLIQAFISFFHEIDQRYCNEELMQSKITLPSKQEIKIQIGFFALPLHKIFSIYLSRVILFNLSQHQLQKGQKSQDIQISSILRKYIDAPPGQNQNTYIQSVIQMILRPLIRQWSFCHEISSGKWVMSGLSLGNIPKFFYMAPENFFFQELGLFQLLISASPEPEKTISFIIQEFEKDAWLRTGYQKLMKREQITSKDMINSLGPIFDSKKLKQMVHWQLRFLIQLCTIEMSYLYPFAGDVDGTKKPDEQKPYLTQEVQNHIQKVFKMEMKRNIAHSLILQGGKADIKELKKTTHKIYVESEFYEDCLIELAEPYKDQNKRAMFKLKDQFFNMLEPYYFFQPEVFPKVDESVKVIKKDRKELNEVLGDYEIVSSQKFQRKKAYESAFRINDTIKRAISQSIFTPYLKELIVYWTSGQNNDFEIIDVQSGYECLKLLSLILESTETNLNGVNNQPAKQYLVQIFSSNEFELVKSLIKLKSQLESVSTSCDILLRQIYNLSPVEFQSIARMMGVEEQEETKDSSEMMEIVDQLQMSRQVSNIELKREEQRRRREQVLQKFQGKRQSYLNKTIDSQSQNSSMLQRSSSSFNESSIISSEDNQIQCSLCKDDLCLDNYFSGPYGQFGYISRNKVMAHSIYQTIQRQDEMIQKLVFSPSELNFEEGKGEINSEQEEEKKSYEVEEESQIGYYQVLNKKLSTVNKCFLSENELSGGTMSKCSHYAHFKCLNDYLISQEGDSRKRELRKIIGLDIKTFQCPLCRHISNCLIPADSLHNYNQRKFDQKDFDQLELLQMSATVFSKIIQSQDLKKNDTLLVDIKNNPIETLQAIENFTMNRLSQIDLSGPYEFLKKSKHSVTCQEYSNLLELTSNLVQIVIESGIKLRGKSESSAFEEDEDMTDFGFDQACLYQIKKKINSGSQKLRADQDIKFLNLVEEDMFQYGFSILYYASMILKQNHVEMMDLFQKLTVQLSKIVKFQALVRALFLKNKGQLLGESASHLQQSFNIEKLLNLAEVPELKEFLIRSQLPFLRKMICLKFLFSNYYKSISHIDYSNNEQFFNATDPLSLEGNLAQLESELLRIRDEKEHYDAIIKTLGHLNDDQEEYKLLCEELKVPVEINFLDDEKAQDTTQQENETLADQEQTQLDQEQSQLQRHKSKIQQIVSMAGEVLNDSFEDMNFGSKDLNQGIIQSLEKISRKSYLSKALDQFIKIRAQTTYSQNVQRGSLQLKMPDQLKLLDTYHTFKLVDLPRDFQALIQEYYKVKCKNCLSQPKDACICLLCGEICCFASQCCKNLPGMRDLEGELTFHTRTCEGGTSLFINISNGKIILIEGDRSAQKNSPYINKFGETYSAVSRKWDNFFLDEANGGLQIYESFCRLYLDNKISNDVINTRSSLDAVWRLRAI